MTYISTEDGSAKVYRSRTGAEVYALERPNAAFYRAEAAKALDTAARDWLLRAAAMKERLGKNADAATVADEVAKERGKGVGRG